MTAPTDPAKAWKRKRLAAIKTKFGVGTLWKHYKGGLYRLENVVIREADGELMAVYFSIDDGTCWVRPLTEFEDAVRDPETGQDVPRFTRDG